jgi:YD repeat-containing protein
MARTYFFWDPLSDNILQERDETGAVTAEYTAEPGLYGNIISQNRGGVESQFHYDAQGSTLAVTDDNQNVTDTFAYTAFGEVTERTGTTEVPFQYIGQKGYYTDGLTGQIMARERPYEPVRARWLSIDQVEELNSALLHATSPTDAARHFLSLDRATLYLLPLVPPPDLTAQFLRSVQRQPGHYDYCSNRPTVFVDPSGLAPIPTPPVPLPQPRIPACAGRRWRKNYVKGRCEFRTLRFDVNFNPITNGCTPPGWGNFGLWDFSLDCDTHDICYQRCGAIKANCDWTFYLNMRRTCSSVPPIYVPGIGNAQDYCYAAASAQYLAMFVDLPGQLQDSHYLFEQWQDYACKWDECCCPRGLKPVPLPDVPHDDSPPV